MNQSGEPKPPASSTRKQTPRVPANVVYDRIIPITLVIMTLVLAGVVIVAVIGLIGALQ
jgi:hypothetical protein